MWILEPSKVSQRSTCVIMHLARCSPKTELGILNLSKVSQRSPRITKTRVVLIATPLPYSGSSVGKVAALGRTIVRNFFLPTPFEAIQMPERAF